MLHRASRRQRLTDRIHARSCTTGRLAIVVALLAASFGIACGDRSTESPTAPTISPASPSPAPPAPAATSVTLRGRVTEPVPTPTTGVEGAIIKVDDGSGTVKSAEANFFGIYSIDGLRPGPIAIEVSANGYVTASRNMFAPADATANFQLALVPKTMTRVIKGYLDPNVGTCSDGISQKPCNIVVIPVHNPGAIEATLTWSPVTSGSLTVTLFQTGQTTPIARSTAQGDGAQLVTATVAGSADYEFRIVYESGTGRVNYSLTVTHQN